MTTRLALDYDAEAVEAISSEFDLRTPNKEALHRLVETLADDYDPSVMQVLNLATGVGKTYLMAAFVEYLRRQGVGNVVIVTPGVTVQTKTVQNFTAGSLRYITGSPTPPEVVTPQDYSAWVARRNGAIQLFAGGEVPMLAFIFNIQQLIAPKDAEGTTHGATRDAMRRKPRRFDENAGVLFDYLKDLDDLVVIADESHLYGASAAAFNAALKELDPAATIGLTASVDKRTDHVIYEYPLYRAIADRYVKAPVLAFRKTGYGLDAASEEQQLRDALQLRALKQSYYDSYVARTGRPHLNAVVFVVCADVDHATQVAELLRTPEYFGRAEAVLQVDSKHEDEVTQRLLDSLDRPESPVLAVVSVNKLKEGWDVKNIAVIVTLRAMASEVLTQQTMGRGLRLPFGAYTHVDHIDQLDIIAHQSFTELLNAENVLRTFGLDNAVPSVDRASVDRAIRAAVGESSLAPVGRPAVRSADASSDTFAPSGSALPGSVGFGSTGFGTPVPNDAGTDTASDSDTASFLPLGQAMATVSSAGTVAVGDSGLPGLGVRAISKDPGQGSVEQWHPVTVERASAFADVTYRFPVTTIEVVQPRVDLAEIDDDELRQASERVTSGGDVLFRKQIVAALGTRLRVDDVERAEVDSIAIPDADARAALVKLVLDMPQLPKTEPPARAVAEFLVNRFAAQVRQPGWTVKSLGSATSELRALVNGYIARKMREERELPVITPLAMPGSGYSLPFGEQIHPRPDSRHGFVARRHYEGWKKSLFTAESFDSYSGEYVLARLLDISPTITWWHRLYLADRAFVHYTARDRYYPDFVALDTSGVHWIIEGKDERGRDDARVQAKRRAAETLVRRLVSEPSFADQHGGYLIAYEDDTGAADSWEDLKSLAHPVSNAL